MYSTVTTMGIMWTNVLHNLNQHGMQENLTNEGMRDVRIFFKSETSSPYQFQNPQSSLAIIAKCALTIDE